MTGFLRLTTRRGVLPSPLPLKRALDMAGHWIDHPLTVLVLPGDRHWLLLRGLLDQTGTGGNLTTDAHLAALALEYDATLCSSDRAYRRFKGLKIEDPLRP
ncbi:MAG: TA system VapC family ribonuclease toxin [Acidobacteriota bacterium]